MLIRTKVLNIEYKEGDIKTEQWDDFQFRLNGYLAHAMEGDYSELFLNGLPHSIIIQLSFDELSAELEILNNFETISLN